MINPRELNVRLCKAGFLTNLAHSKTLRLIPPLTITEGEVNKAMDVLETVIKSV